MMKPNVGSDSNLQIEEKEKETFVDYPYRWVNMVLYFMPSMMNAVAWITFSSISTQIEKAYDQSQFVVTLTSLVYMIVYVFVNFPSNYILQVLIGCILTIGGAWIRILINENFWWAILGQILGGIGQPIILNAPSKIAGVWFKPDQRQIATSLLAVINTLGAGLGFLFPSFFVDDKFSDKTRDQVYDMLFWQAVMITISIAPCFLFFREKPPTPPSLAAETEKISFQQSFSITMNNPDFRYLLGGFGLTLGNINCLSTVVNFYIEQFGFSSDATSYFGALFLVSGVVGSGVLSKIVQKTNAYKKVMVSCSGLSCLFNALVLGVLFTESLYLLLPACFLMGFFTTALIPISMEFACEITFPVSEPFSSGFTLTSGQIIGAILVAISTQAITLESQLDVAISMCIGIGLQAVGLLLYTRVHQTLKRSGQEELKVWNEPTKDLKEIEKINRGNSAYQQNEMVL